MFGFNPAITEVSAEEVKNNIDKKSRFFLLDVRTEAEYARGHIPGSINIPLDDITNSVEQFLIDKSIPVYVYCLSGSRSQMAAAEMADLGYKTIFSIKSGLLAWRALGYPMTE